MPISPKNLLTGSSLIWAALAELNAEEHALRIR